jgi:hypothetical protein
LSSDPDKKMMWFGLAGFLLARRAFGTAAQVPSFTNLPLLIKTVFLTINVPLILKVRDVWFFSGQNT